LPGQSLISRLRISCRRVRFRKLRGPLTEICLPKVVLVKGQIGVDAFCASVEISTKHLCCVHCAPELFAPQHAYIQWHRRGFLASTSSGIAIALKTSRTLTSWLKRTRILVHDISPTLEGMVTVDPIAMHKRLAPETDLTH